MKNILRKQRRPRRLTLVKEKQLESSLQRSMQKSLLAAEKKSRVQSMKRAQAYKRKQMLEKIKSDTERAQSLKMAKEQLQEKRKNANMRATFERQMIYEVMEKIQSGKNLGGTGNGDLSIEQLKAAASSAHRSP